MGKIKKALVTAENSDQGGGRNAGNVYTPKDSRIFQSCQPRVPFPLSPTASARLELLATRTGLEPAAIVDALVRAADPQLIAVACRLHLGGVGSGYRRGHVQPLSVFVGQKEH